jgi:hypothetical protein
MVSKREKSVELQKNRDESEEEEEEEGGEEEEEGEKENGKGTAPAIDKGDHRHEMMKVGDAEKGESKTNRLELDKKSA